MPYPIRVHDVHFEYVPGEPVLQGVTVEFTSGSTAIIGQNGAGKTTLMKLLNSLLKPTNGVVHVGDLDTSVHKPGHIARHVGIVFQNPDDQIFKSRVLDEVMFGPLNIGMSPSDARASAIAALQMMELETQLEANPYDLSYAERKRICVASVLAMRTDVVIFDEPTISQDVYALALITNVIRTLITEGKTVIAIVHDMNFAAENFERIVVMAEGKVVADGTPAQVFTNVAALSRAHVAAPAMVQLSEAMGMSECCLTVPTFVAGFQGGKA